MHAVCSCGNNNNSKRTCLKGIIITHWPWTEKPFTQFNNKIMKIISSHSSQQDLIQASRKTDTTYNLLFFFIGPSYLILECEFNAGSYSSQAACLRD
jgi:hypothetical protein